MKQRILYRKQITVRNSKKKKNYSVVAHYRKGKNIDLKLIIPMTEYQIKKNVVITKGKGFWGAFKKTHDYKRLTLLGKKLPKRVIVTY